MNLASAIALCGAVLGALLAVALKLARGRNRIANGILAVFALVYAVHLLLLAPLFSDHPYVLRLSPLFLNDVFLFGPLLYLYVRAMTEPGFRLARRDALHLLPFALALAVELAIDAPGNAIELLRQAGERGWPPSPAAAIALGFYVSFIAYLALSLRRLRAHALWVAQHCSRLEGVSLRWLWLLISVSLALSTLGLLVSIARLFIDLSLLPRGGYSMLMMIALFHLIAFMAIWQPAIFHADLAQPPAPAPAPAAEPAAPRYETSALDAEQVERHWLRLLALMEERKPHLDNALRLAQLAALLAMPPHQLSQVINQSAGQHFLEFITRYRIEEAKVLLRSERYRGRKMSALAFDAGFNSQSAFYKQFKKHVGSTPQAYRAQFPAPLQPAVR